MCCKGILKRMVPFLLTLAVGLFIASFFVDLSPAPFRSRDRGMRRFKEYQELKMENMELRERNAQLQSQLEELRKNSTDRRRIEKWTIREVDVPPPPAPPARTQRIVR
jgi:hypothetical protein